VSNARWSARTGPGALVRTEDSGYQQRPASVAGRCARCRGLRDAGYRPAGPRQHRQVHRRWQDGPPRLSGGRAASRVRRLHDLGRVESVGVRRQADGQPAARRSAVSQACQQPAASLLVQVDQQSFADEQARPGAVVTATRQHAGDVVVAEVHGREHGRMIGADGTQPPRLVRLGVGVVELEEPDPGGAEPQRAVVVTRSAYHDLADAGRDRLLHLLVHESRPRFDAGPQPLRRVKSHSGAEPGLRSCVAVGADGSVETGPAERDRLTRSGRTGSIHTHQLTNLWRV
jgi:hypothetical protein